MTIGARIEEALSPLGLPVSPNEDRGTSRTYITYSYQSVPGLFAAGYPGAMLYLISVNLYLPDNVNPNTLQNSISKALKNAGFTYPSTVNISDEDGQGYCFECQGFDGSV